jgi:CDP-diacylglycerol--glycerol-3-phosphate 3-phosphatidyltransferase
MIRSLQNTGLLGVSLLLATSACLSLWEDWSFARQWLLQSTVVWVLVWQQCWRHRHLNRAAAELPPHATLGLANRLTILRGWLIAATAGFILQSPDNHLLLWIPAALYSVAAILDRIDGFVARKTGQTSLMGASLDTVFDALGLVIAPLLAVLYAKVHWSFLLVSLAYYLFQTGLYWRQRRGRVVYPLPPNTLRRTLAGFQMGYVAVALWPPFHSSITIPAGFGFMIPVLLGFLADWLFVSGRIAASPENLRLFTRLSTFSALILQPALRILLSLSLLALILSPFLSLRDTPLLITTMVLSTALLALGIGARIGALFMILLLASSAMIQPDETVLVYTLLFSAIGILLLDAGRFSLWNGDDRWIKRHDGMP